MHLSQRSTFRLPTTVCVCWRGVLAGWLFFGVGCARLSPTRPAVTANVPGAAAVRYLGTVHVIGTGRRFVLVQASVAAVAAGLTDGQTLVCRVSGADSATLRVSRERRPPFVVADVASGEPHVGDEVFVEPASNPATKPAAPAPAAPSASPTAAPTPVPSLRTDLVPPAS